MGKSTLSELLRAPQGVIDLDDFDPRDTPGYDEDKEEAAADLADLGETLEELQEKLFARGRSYPEEARRILLILQGMDTAGKGGVIRHAMGLIDPQGVQIKAFKQPTEEELAHDFLWRIRKEVPERGMIGIFDRSQYEDVLIVRVENLVPEDEWHARYDIINAFEQELVDSDVIIIKCFLHISADEQKERLMERLERPDKHWKYNPGDLDSRAKWDEYTRAYEELLAKCNPDHAPWYIVPSDRKWYRNWAVAQLVAERLKAMDLQWPTADFDVAAETERLAEA